MKNDLLNLQNTNLSGQNSELIDMVKNLGLRQQELDRWSERVPLITMMEGVRFPKLGSSWRAPKGVSTGSTIKLFGFDCSLNMRIGSQEYNYRGRGRNEFPVVGPSGATMSLHIRRQPSGSPNFGNTCYGKVQVISTDRTASDDPSYEP